MIALSRQRFVGVNQADETREERSERVNHAIKQENKFLQRYLLARAPIRNGPRPCHAAGVRFKADDEGSAGINAMVFAIRPRADTRRISTLGRPKLISRHRDLPVARR